MEGVPGAWCMMEGIHYVCMEGVSYMWCVMEGVLGALSVHGA